MNSLRVLVLDIETAPIIASVWGLKDQNIGLNQIQRDWSIIAYGAKWLDEPASKVMYEDLRDFKDITDDTKLLKSLWKLLDEADILITQNGQSFDAPKINARFILHGMKPPSPYRHLDTYRIVKKVTDFTSNKLEYLTDKLCTKYKKLHHHKFPGMSLWNECLKNNKQAWDEMKIYNIHDVLSTEELFNKIRAWIPESMPDIHPQVGAKKPVRCGGCNSADLAKDGTRLTQKGMYQRYHCKGCGKWISGEKIK